MNNLNILKISISIQSLTDRISEISVTRIINIIQAAAKAILSANHLFENDFEPFGINFVIGMIFSLSISLLFYGFIIFNLVVSKSDQVINIDWYKEDSRIHVLFIIVHGLYPIISRQSHLEVYDVPTRIFFIGRENR